MLTQLLNQFCWLDTLLHNSLLWRSLELCPDHCNWEGHARTWKRIGGRKLWERKLENGIQVEMDLHCTALHWNPQTPNKQNCKFLEYLWHCLFVHLLSMQLETEWLHATLMTMVHTTDCNCSKLSQIFKKFTILFVRGLGVTELQVLQGDKSDAWCLTPFCSARSNCNKNPLSQVAQENSHFFSPVFRFFACIPVGGLSSACNFIYVSFLVFVFVVCKQLNFHLCLYLCLCLCPVFCIFARMCCPLCPPVSTPAIPQPNFLHLILSPMCCFGYFASTAMYLTSNSTKY